MESPHLKLLELPFTSELIEKGFGVFVVGGIVRDYFISKFHNKEIVSKDLDILVTGVDFNALLEILKNYGYVDLVGESFSIIKYKSFDKLIECDLATARIERKIGEGHKGFEVISNSTITLKQDMFRRDFKMNAIAISHAGEVIDYFDGLSDIQNSLCSMVDETTFSDDILRYLRCIVFASRFNFKIESKTFETIKYNAFKIKEISSERILIEFQKIIDKSNIKLATKLLIDSELFYYIFYGSHNRNFNLLNNVKTLGEYIYLICPRLASKFYKENLKGDIETYKEIIALEHLCHSYYTYDNKNKILLGIFEAINISEKVINTTIFDDDFEEYLIPFKNGTLPKSRKELKINGNDLINIGLKDKEIGNTIKYCIEAIISNIVKNEKEDLLKLAIYLKENNCLNE